MLLHMSNSMVTCTKYDLQYLTDFRHYTIFFRRWAVFDPFLPHIYPLECPNRLNIVNHILIKHSSNLTYEIAYICKFPHSIHFLLGDGHYLPHFYPIFTPWSAQSRLNIADHILHIQSSDLTCETAYICTWMVQRCSYELFSNHLVNTPKYFLNFVNRRPHSYFIEVATLYTKQNMRKMMSASDFCPYLEIIWMVQRCSYELFSESLGKYPEVFFGFCEYKASFSFY